MLHAFRRTCRAPSNHIVYSSCRRTCRIPSVHIVYLSSDMIVVYLLFMTDYIDFCLAATAIASCIIVINSVARLLFI